MWQRFLASGRSSCGETLHIVTLDMIYSNLDFCRKEFVEEFDFLLDSCRDGIEVSYNAAGVLAHMASDGPEAWTIENPER